MFLSIVVPAYNEDENIPILYEKISSVLAKQDYDYEILIVDDGSTDETFKRCMDIHNKDSRLAVIKFEKNCGQTAAFIAGFEAARGEHIITMDADLQNDPEDIPLIVEKLKDSDVVCGWRKSRKDSIVRLISSRIANFVRNKLSQEDIRDTGCSIKGFHRKCLENLPRFEGMHRFFPTLVKMKGYSVAEVAVNHFPRVHGESKYGISNRLMKSFVDLLAVRWMKTRCINYSIEKKLQ